MKNGIGLNFGSVGLGQCGGNIANEFAKLGYKAMAINTAETDLSKLEHIHDNNKLLVNVGVHGAGKNPEIGKQALIEHVDKIDNAISQLFDDSVDVIFVNAGLGGGSGTGMIVDLTEHLCDKYSAENGNKKVICLILTIPSESETSKIQIVALDAFERISQIQGLGAIFVVDNQKTTTSLPSTMGLKTKYSVVNANIVNMLDQINCLTTMPSEVVFDARELLTLFVIRGSGILLHNNITDIGDLKKPEYLPQVTSKAISSSLFADVDYKSAMGLGVMLELPAGGSNLVTDVSLLKTRNEFGDPFESYNGIYETKTSGKEAREASVYYIATGLPFPFERLGKIQTDLEKKAENLSQRFEQNANQTFVGNGQNFRNKFINGSVQPKAAPSGESTLSKLLNKKK